VKDIYFESPDFKKLVSKLNELNKSVPRIINKFEKDEATRMSDLIKKHVSVHKYVSGYHKERELNIYSKKIIVDIEELYNRLGVYRDIEGRYFVGYYLNDTYADTGIDSNDILHKIEYGDYSQGLSSYPVFRITKSDMMSGLDGRLKVYANGVLNRILNENKE